MEDERITLAAPIIFILVILIQFLPKYFDRQIKNGGGTSAEEKKLRDETKQLLEEANSLSQPSTFAQAAKLRRTAVAKEKQLVKYQEQQTQERKLSYDPYMKYATPVKQYLKNLSNPLVSEIYVIPFPYRKVLSWKSGSGSVDKVTIGVIPWLILCTRVSKLICRKVITQDYKRLAVSCCQ